MKKTSTNPDNTKYKLKRKIGNSRMEQSSGRKTEKCKKYKKKWQTHNILETALTAHSNLSTLQICSATNYPTHCFPYSALSQIHNSVFCCCCRRRLLWFLQQAFSPSSSSGNTPELQRIHEKKNSIILSFKFAAHSIDQMQSSL